MKCGGIQRGDENEILLCVGLSSFFLLSFAFASFLDNFSSVCVLVQLTKDYTKS
uniref:Uncharacterized protein n=1 Tax=Arundo donax TaxID=35708 RepID=A0A0A9FG57_ARUDO